MLSTSGTITVPTEHEVTENGTIMVDGKCDAAAGFQDVHAGAQITLLDPDGKIVALGELEPGKNGAGADCVFKFTITDIPPGRKFYSVDVGNEFRGIYTIPEDDLREYQSLFIG